MSEQSTSPTTTGQQRTRRPAKKSKPKTSSDKRLTTDEEQQHRQRLPRNNNNSITEVNSSNRRKNQLSNKKPIVQKNLQSSQSQSITRLSKSSSISKQKKQSSTPSQPPGPSRTNELTALLHRISEISKDQITHTNTSSLSKTFKVFNRFKLTIPISKIKKLELSKFPDCRYTKFDLNVIKNFNWKVSLNNENDKEKEYSVLWCVNYLINSIALLERDPREFKNLEEVMLKERSILKEKNSCKLDSPKEDQEEEAAAAV